MGYCGLIFKIVIVCCAFARRSASQSVDDDSACLEGLRQAVVQVGPLPLGAADLMSWSSSSLQSACKLQTAASSLAGVTCNDGRVFAIVLNSSSLKGALSPAIAKCAYLQNLDISSNSISGSIPSDVGALAYLTSFNASSNELQGSIPAELSACAYLNDIDLHGNKLDGSIPGQLGLLQRLNFFDVSNNKLSGLIPSTLSNTSTGAPRFNTSSFVGNEGLYGYPLG